MDSLPQLQTVSLRDIFSDPLSQQIMENPVTDPCGHTFDKDSIWVWLGKKSICPISHQHLTSIQLVAAPIIKDALSIISDVNKKHLSPKVTIDYFPEKDRVILRQAMEILLKQREKDTEEGLSYKVVLSVEFQRALKIYLAL